jgi:hypothetical protein
MRSTSFIFVAILAAAFCFLPATSLAKVGAADSSPQSCGATPREAIAAAEKALSGNRQEDQMRALVCLLTAVKTLEAERLETSRGKEQARMLRVPRNP